MAKHMTQKRSRDGKAQTLARKARRAAKYATAELDLAVLDLTNPLPA